MKTSRFCSAVYGSPQPRKLDSIRPMCIVCDLPWRLTSPSCVGYQYTRLAMMGAFFCCPYPYLHIGSSLAGINSKLL